MKEPIEMENILKFTQWYSLEVRTISMRKTHQFNKALEGVLSRCFPRNLKSHNSKSSIEITTQLINVSLGDFFCMKMMTMLLAPNFF